MCNFETTAKGVGRHYHNTHNLKLKDNPEVYLGYFEFNNPGLLVHIKEMITNGIGLKSIHKKYNNIIGAGSLPILKKALVDVYPDDFMKLVTQRSRETLMGKIGFYYSTGFTKNISGFNDIELAKKASKIAHGNPDYKSRLVNRMKIDNPSHNPTTIEKRKTIYKNKSGEEKIDIINKRKKTCRDNNSYLKRAETIIKKYGGFVAYGNKTTGHSRWHDDVKKLLLKNDIITESEQTVVSNYTSDEVDHNNKVIIELNGDFWHCNPLNYNPNYFHPFIKLTANEIWKRDEKRIAEYKNNGWDVFIIWESEDVNKKIDEYKKLYG